jgi:cytochrome c oxidase subunit IV
MIALGLISMYMAWEYEKKRRLQSAEAEGKDHAITVCALIWSLCFFSTGSLTIILQTVLRLHMVLSLVAAHDLMLSFAV